MTPEKACSCNENGIAMNSKFIMMEKVVSHKEKYNILTGVYVANNFF